MTLTHFTDETLMAYADGRLDPETAASVEAAARTDTTLQARIATFRATGDALSSLADARRAAPVPDALRARVEQAIVAARPAAAQEPSQPKSAKVLPFGQPGKSASTEGPRRFSFVPMAMAASLALVIGLGAG